MNQDDFMYGYEVGKSEHYFPIRISCNKGNAAGSAIGKGIWSLINGMFDLALQVIILSIKGLLLLMSLLITLVKKFVPMKN